MHSFRSHCNRFIECPLLREYTWYPNDFSEEPRNRPFSVTYGSAFPVLRRITSVSVRFPLSETQNLSHNQSFKKVRPLAGILRQMEEIMKIGYVRVSNQE